MTSSISETDLSSSKEDSGNESLKLAHRRKPKVPVIKKAQSNKGNFAHIKKVKNLSANVLKNSSSDSKNGQLRPKNWLKIRRSNGKDNGKNGGSPLTVPRLLSKNNVQASSASELSTAGIDLEYDYYDYDMENASAVPGSLFGLDPTLMPWLPSILNIDEADDDEEIYVTNGRRHPLSVSQSTLKDFNESECIPMKEFSKKKTESLDINLDTGNEYGAVNQLNKTESLDNKLDNKITPESSHSKDLTASQAISLSDNSDEIPFADDSDEGL